MTFMMIPNWKKPFGFHGLYNFFSVRRVNDIDKKKFKVDISNSQHNKSTKASLKTKQFLLNLRIIRLHH